jgi:hypothetical protein
MNPRLTAFVAVLALAVLAACSGAPRQGGERVRNQGNSIVIEGNQLRSSGGTLLGAMNGRVASLRVNRLAGQCPLVSFRGQRTLTGTPGAGVYVDRSRFADTCILEQLRARDVQRVEIYPSGYTSRPGYAPNPHGLILVFLRTTARMQQP